MDLEGEERILRQAIAKGLIGETDLAPSDSSSGSSGRWGARIERLLEVGRLDEIAVAALAEEVAAWSSDEPARTLGAAPGDGSEAPAPEPPTTTDRYQVLARLGSGAGGDVFRARDLRLDREVALKFLHADRSEHAARLRREAQAQARIEHEHVCKVFEVGELAGRSFIAMQLVDGKTLHEAATAMTLEERVRLVRQVAEAVHAAHRLGIVHRDLKPGNVMVERDADGAWKPWVVDFGLATELERSASSVGAVGTPAFMAPEQARGDRALIDRRSDVYGLGATLFAALTGRPPFVGSTLEVLAQVLAGEAQPLRRLVPAIPADLETIVARCLERDPARRYDSARALADELGRFLDGEPILARPARWPERIVRRLRRQRALVAVSAAALVAVTLVAALWLRSAWSAREQARVAQQFGQETQAIESLMRVAHLLPPHDIRPDRARVRARMRALEEKMQRGGVSARGPGQYALGRGALALGDLTAARAHLEQAWNGGYRAPEVAYALGQILGEQYQAALHETAAIEGEQDRKARQQQAARELRDPALAYLRLGRGAAADTPAFVEALIAFRDDRFDEALARLAQARRDVPSLYEASRLAGDVYALMAAKGRERGDIDGTLALATRAAAAYQEAAEVARSDESIPVADCWRRLDLLPLDLDRGKPIEDAAAAALAACDRALAIDPDSGAAYRYESAILIHLGEAEVQHGKDPRATLARAVAQADAALARNPRDDDALARAGMAWEIQADLFESVHGIDPRPSYARAIDCYERSLAIRLSSNTLNLLGNVNAGWGDYENLHGGDPRPHWERDTASLRRAIALEPGYFFTHLNLGGQLRTRAEYNLAHGIDPRPAVETALAAQRRAIELNPTQPIGWNNLGATWAVRAIWERAQGLDCRAAADEALRGYRKAVELKPDRVFSYDNMAEIWLLLAQQQLDRGLDPSPPLGEARAALTIAHKLSPTDKYSAQYLARIELIAARAAARPADAAASFAGALAAIRRSTQLDPTDADTREVEAEIWRWQAEQRLARHAAAATELDHGMAAAAQALTLNPKLPSGLAVKSTLLALQARAQRDPQKRAAQEAEARALGQRALELNPLLKRDYPRL